MKARLSVWWYVKKKEELKHTVIDELKFEKLQSFVYLELLVNNTSDTIEEIKRRILLASRNYFCPQKIC